MQSSSPDFSGGLAVPPTSSAALARGPPSWIPSLPLITEALAALAHSSLGAPSAHSLGYRQDLPPNPWPWPQLPSLRLAQTPPSLPPSLWLTADSSSAGGPERRLTTSLASQSRLLSPDNVFSRSAPHNAPSHLGSHQKPVSSSTYLWASLRPGPNIPG